MTTLLFLLACTPDSATPDGNPSVPTAMPFFVERDGGFEANALDQGMHTRIEDGAATVTTTDGTLRLRPALLGRAETLAPLDACDATLDGQRVSTTCGDAVAWFSHDEDGLEFGADVATAPEGDGPLLFLLDYAEAGDPWMAGANAYFAWETQQIEIGEPTVVDALGAEVPSVLSLHCVGDDPEVDADGNLLSDDAADCYLAVEVDDADAVYPITIDPRVQRTSDKSTKMSHLTMADLVPGDLVITEFMVDPVLVPDSHGEWIELTNTTASDIELSGLVFYDRGSNEWQFGGSLEVVAGGTVVFGRNTNTSQNGDTDVDVAYSGYNLAEGNDAIIVAYKPTGTSNCRSSSACTIIDSVDYTNAWRHTAQIRSAGAASSTERTFFTQGASYSLEPLFTNWLFNDLRTSWCDGFTQYGNGHFGTPNAPNDSCSFTLDFEFEWETTPGTFVSGCTFISARSDGTFTTGNSGDGTFQRYTYYGSANQRGQFIEWVYDYTSPATVDTHYWTQRDFNVGNGDFDASEVIAFDPGFAVSGSFETPCPPPPVD